MTASITSPTSTTTTAPVSSSSTTVSIDLASVFNTVTQATVARQVQTIGDPQDYNQIARVTRRPLTGSEPALAVALAPNSTDLNAIMDLLGLILIELKSLNSTLNGITTDSVPTP